MSAPADYPRDLVGYGRQPPFADWPGHARVAVQFVLNGLLGDLVGFPLPPPQGFVATIRSCHE